MKECINSIKNQTFKNYEVWVVDGLSIDGTKEYLKTLEEPFYWLFESDLGIYDAMNKGVEKASGEWAYFLGCDDRLFNESTLKNIFNRGEEIKNSDVIIGQIQYDLIGNESYFLKKNKGIIISSLTKKMWLLNTIHHQAIFYRKDIFLKLKYSLRYKILSDYNLNLNLFKQGVKKLVINDKISICKTNGKSKNYNWKLYKEEVELKTKNSSFLLKPIFYLIGIGKYIIKKTF